MGKVAHHIEAQRKPNLKLVDSAVIDGRQFYLTKGAPNYIAICERESAEVIVVAATSPAKSWEASQNNEGPNIKLFPIR